MRYLPGHTKSPRHRNWGHQIRAVLLLTLFLFAGIAPAVSAENACGSNIPDEQCPCPAKMDKLDCTAIIGPWTNWKPSTENACATGSATVNPASTTTANSSANLSQVLSFAREPITSTWGISDSTVEQWFLQQATARPTMTKYGLSSGNIGEITSAVKAAGVSPVYFYLYTVNEGGGLGGFINHYSNDSGGGGVADATRDAQYIVSQAQKTSDNPAWVDVDNYNDFVPKNIQDAGNADFKNMPTGTIGRIYIPATAAAAWEVYYPDGLKAEFNGVQNYGPPLQGLMKNIERIGGNPMEGGATISSVSCTSAGGAVAGAGMTKAINWAKMIANNDGYGYDQGTSASGYRERTTGWTKWQSDPSCTNQCGSFDCSSFVSAALTEAGYFTANPNFSTSGEESALQQAGFTRVNASFDTSKDLLPGDILVAPGSHTEIYIGNNQTVGAHEDENHGINGGQVGDQTSKEISVVPYENHPWASAWRATKDV